VREREKEREKENGRGGRREREREREREKFIDNQYMTERERSLRGGGVALSVVV
jgi:hypothetical protein